MNNAAMANLAVHKVCADLLSKGHYPFIPTGEFALPVDLIILTAEQTVLRMQVKYTSTGYVGCHSQQYGKLSKRYHVEAFDYYAVYLPDVDVVVYPNIKFGGVTIATSIRRSEQPFWWYKDFLEFTDAATQKSGREMGADYSHKNKPRLSNRKQRPSKEELKLLLESNSVRKIAELHSVSDTSIKRWAREYNLVG